MVSRPQEVSTDSEESLHDTVHRREPVALSGRRDTPHLALPLTRRVVGDLGSIVRVLISDVDHGRHHGAGRGGGGARRCCTNSDWPARGEFKWSSQHLKWEELRWEQLRVDELIMQDAFRGGRPVVHRWGGGSIGRDSGRRLRTGCRARMPGWWPVCRRRSARGGSATMAGCRQAVWPRFRGAICRSANERRSRSCTLRASGFVRSRGGSADVHRRSRGNCAGTLRPVVATCSIEPQLPSGTPTGVPNVRKSRSSPRTRNCATMYKTDSQVSSPPPTGPVCLDQMCAGSVGSAGAAGSDAGRVRGVRSRLLTGSESMFPRMIRCGSPTRPSTRRSTCKAAVHCGGNWSRVCGLGGRFECPGRVPGAEARRSSAPRS